MLQLLRCKKRDFDQILHEVGDFWGHERMLPLHQPLFLYEFGDTAYVLREGDTVVAYLFGFYAQTSLTACVHLAAVRLDYQRMGLGQTLYEHFIEQARKDDRRYLKAVTTPDNVAAIRFHKKLGMALVGEDDSEGLLIVRDYSGTGKHRVVFHMTL